MKRLIATLACAGSVSILGASPSPAPSVSAIPVDPTVIGGPPQAGPAPRLDMGEFRPQAYDPKATGSVRVRIAFQSKLAGLLFWKRSKVFVLPDNAYGRWVVAAFTDHYLNRTKAWTFDPAVDRCCARVATTDASGNATVDHLAAGNYLLFGGYYTQSGHSRTTYASYPGFDENGNAVQVSVPTLVFTDSVFETFVTMTPFAIATGAPAVTVEPVAIVDVISR